jgi:hypothetical protein
MTPASLASALRACAAGLYPLQAGVGPLIANGTFLHRDDFTSRFILHGTTGHGGSRLGSRHRRADGRGTALLGRRTADLQAGSQHRRRHPRRSR